jgi:hypothetical protein
MIWAISYIAFCVVLAFINYEVIDSNKRVYHGLNGAAHLLAWAGIFAITHSWVLVAAMPFLARVVFDTSLNLMRDKPIDYVTAKPKSIVDKMEQKVFGKNGYAPKIIYLTIAITLIIIYAIN